jgi:DNA-binding PadR family transcriptional regulator
MSSSDHTQMAVLGALSIAPMSGYAVREQIRDILGHFWSESFGQIYPALSELQQQGMVERRDTGDSRSSKFAITDTGLLRLRELLAEAPQSAKPRNGLMLRLFFGRQLGIDACRQLILDARTKAETQLADLRNARAELSTDTGDDTPYMLLTVLAGEHTARAAIAWADEALTALHGFPIRGVQPGPTATPTKEKS